MVKNKPSRLKVKICGITNLEDALAAAASGADALGFIFYKKSPRYISPLQARRICRLLPEKIAKVGVFVDEKELLVKKTAKLLGLDMLQFHGNEPAPYCRLFKGYKVIKAFRINKPDDLRKTASYGKCYGYLFDSGLAGRLGGTGVKFNWKILAKAAKMKPVVFVSGGLKASNVGAAVKLLKPGWVDACSSLEKAPGKKDKFKVRDFIRAAKKFKYA